MDKSKNPGISIASVHLFQCSVGDLNSKSELKFSLGITQANVGNVLWEAFGNYLGFDAYHPGQATPGKYAPVLPFG